MLTELNDDEFFFFCINYVVLKIITFTATKKSDIYTKTNLLVGSWPLLILTVSVKSLYDLSLKKSDLIKSDRFWHQIDKLKTVAGLRPSLNCDPPALTSTKF